MRAPGLLAIIGAPASAEPPLSAEALAAHVGTNTLPYPHSTGDRGSADYRPDRRVRWAFDGQPCLDGRWFARDDGISFAFADGRRSACGQAFGHGDGLRGTASERGSGKIARLDIRETGRNADALACPGPKVGV